MNAVPSENYIQTFKAAIARIYHANGAIVGAGFLARDGYLLTCAHVVTMALGISQNTQEMPAGTVELDFPLIAPGQKVKARVVCWHPVDPAQVGEDIAGLELEDKSPSGVKPLRLAAVAEYWGHSFMLFGFPKGHEEGVWVSGVFRDERANGWVQLEDVKTTGYQVEPGFSGAPVWDESLEGVVGMAIAAEKQREDVKAAFMLPVKLLTPVLNTLNLPILPKDLTQTSGDTTQTFTKSFKNGVELEMVAIPGGSFEMGSPRNELERMGRESPQHRVVVPSFWMGKYPVTQALWQVIAVLPQINRKLALDPLKDLNSPEKFKNSLKKFKGDDRPIVEVSWFDAVEFCDRLSQETGCEYRLPSEAEWEYACRAGTTTPFHFGEAVTTDLANYDGNSTYNSDVEGVYRKETTAVDSFGVANAFGLYDVHGNVWEWCIDHWHNSYEGAPTDGSAWMDRIEIKNRPRVLRGGSWNNKPKHCRSAARFYYDADGRDSSLGFRVVCSSVYALLSRAGE